MLLFCALFCDMKPILKFLCSLLSCHMKLFGLNRKAKTACHMDESWMVYACVVGGTWMSLGCNKHSHISIMKTHRDHEIRTPNPIPTANPQPNQNTTPTPPRPVHSVVLLCGFRRGVTYITQTVEIGKRIY